MRALVLGPTLAVIAALSVAPTAHAQSSQTCVWVGASSDVFTADGVAHDNVQHLIQQERNVVILNISVGGQGIATDGGFNGTSFIQSLDRLSGEGDAIDCIIITAGGNDFRGQTWGAVRSGLIAIFDWARDNEARVLLVDLPWRSANETGVSPTMGIDYATYRERRAALCRPRPFCKFAERPPIFDEATPSLYAERERPDDLTHFNPAGQRRRANWIMREADDNGFGWRATGAQSARATERGDYEREPTSAYSEQEEQEERGGLLGRVGGISGRLDDASHEAFGVVERLIWGER